MNTRKLFLSLLGTLISLKGIEGTGYTKTQYPIIMGSETTGDLEFEIAQQYRSQYLLGGKYTPPSTSDTFACLALTKRNLQNMELDFFFYLDTERLISDVDAYYVVESIGDMEVSSSGEIIAVTSPSILFLTLTDTSHPTYRVFSSVYDPDLFKCADGCEVDLFYYESADSIFLSFFTKTDSSLYLFKFENVLHPLPDGSSQAIQIHKYTPPEYDGVASTPYHSKALLTNSLFTFMNSYISSDGRGLISFLEREAPFIDSTVSLVTRQIRFEDDPITPQTIQALISTNQDLNGVTYSVYRGMSKKEGQTKMTVFETYMDDENSQDIYLFRQYNLINLMGEGNCIGAFQKSQYESIFLVSYMNPTDQYAPRGFPLGIVYMKKNAAFEVEKLYQIQLHIGMNPLLYSSFKLKKGVSAEYEGDGVYNVVFLTTFKPNQNYQNTDGVSESQVQSFIFSTESTISCSIPTNNGRSQGAYDISLFPNPDEFYSRDPMIIDESSDRTIFDLSYFADFDYLDMIDHSKADALISKDIPEQTPFCADNGDDFRKIDQSNPPQTTQSLANQNTFTYTFSFETPDELSGFEPTQLKYHLGFTLNFDNPFPPKNLLSTSNNQLSKTYQISPTSANMGNTYQASGTSKINLYLQNRLPADGRLDISDSYFTPLQLVKFTDMPGLTQTFNFEFADPASEVIVFDPSSCYYISQGVQSSILYILSSSKITISLAKFTLSSPLCSDYFSTTIKVNNQLLASSNSFLELNSDEQTLSIFSTANSDIGSYSIKIYGQLTKGDTSQKFVSFLLTVQSSSFFEIKDPGSSDTDQGSEYVSTSGLDLVLSKSSPASFNPATLFGLETSQYLFKLSAIEQGASSYQSCLELLEQNGSSDSSTEGGGLLLKVIQSPAELAQWDSLFTSSSGQEQPQIQEILSLDVYNRASNSYLKQIQIDIQLIGDALIESYMNLKALENLNLTGSISSPTGGSKGAVLFAEINKVTRAQTLELKFQTKIQSYLTLNSLQQDLRFTINQTLASGGYQVSKLQFKPTKIDKALATFSLQFQNSDLVSNYNKRDIIQVELAKNSWTSKVLSTLYSKVLQQNLSRIVDVEKAIPSQLRVDDQVYINSFSSSASSAYASMFAMAFLLNLLMSVSLQHLWGSMNVMQIISHLPLVTIAFPANTMAFFTILLQIASFQLYPTDFINEFWQINDDDQVVFSDNFEEVGYDTQNILLILGMLLVTLYFNIVYYFFYLLAWLAFPWLFQSYPSTAKQLKNPLFRLVNRFCLWSREKLIFACALVFILEAYFELGIASLLNLYDFKLDNFSQTSSSYHSVIIFPIVVLFPFLSATFLYLNRTRLNDESFKEKFGSLYEGLETGKSNQVWISQYHNFNLVRKLIQVLTFIQFREYTFVQFFTLIFTSLWIIMYVFLTKPFEDPFMVKMELFNEMTIILIMYSMLCFTDLNLNDETKYDLGYVPIALFFFNFLVHLINMSVRSFLDIRDALIKLKAKITVWRAEGKCIGCLCFSCCCCFFYMCCLCCKRDDEEDNDKDKQRDDIEAKLKPQQTQIVIKMQSYLSKNERKGSLRPNSGGSSEGESALSLGVNITQLHQEQFDETRAPHRKIKRASRNSNKHSKNPQSKQNSNEKPQEFTQSLNSFGQTPKNTSGNKKESGVRYNRTIKKSSVPQMQAIFEDFEGERQPSYLFDIDPDHALISNEDTQVFKRNELNQLEQTLDPLNPKPSNLSTAQRRGKESIAEKTPFLSLIPLKQNEARYQQRSVPISFRQEPQNVKPTIAPASTHFQYPELKSYRLAKVNNLIANPDMSNISKQQSERNGMQGAKRRIFESFRDPLSVFSNVGTGTRAADYQNYYNGQQDGRANAFSSLFNYKDKDASNSSSQ